MSETQSVFSHSAIATPQSDTKSFVSGLSYLKFNSKTKRSILDQDPDELYKAAINREKEKHLPKLIANQEPK